MKLPKVSAGVGRCNQLNANQRMPDSILPSAGCGTDWHEPLVPEKWGNANFNSACSAHDDCYETCGKSKEHCDDVFRNELHDACHSAYSRWWQAVDRRLCKEAANTYHSAVNRMGGDAYRKAQREHGCS
uniref:hypothetical protein n=1 Tax=Candidatus Electronema sp. TaxID=2698783 RepID=UPI0040563001